MNIPQGGNQEEQQNQMRNILTACIVLTKHKVYNLQKEIQGVLESFSKQQQQQTLLYKKIMGLHLEACYNSMDYQTSLKVNLNNKLNLFSYYK